MRNCYPTAFFPPANAKKTRERADVGAHFCLPLQPGPSLPSTLHTNAVREQKMEQGKTFCACLLVALGPGGIWPVGDAGRVCQSNYAHSKLTSNLESPPLPFSCDAPLLWSGGHYARRIWLWTA